MFLVFTEKKENRPYDGVELCRPLSVFRTALPKFRGKKFALRVVLPKGTNVVVERRNKTSAIIQLACPCTGFAGVEVDDRMTLLRSPDSVIFSLNRNVEYVFCVLLFLLFWLACLFKSGFTCAGTPKHTCTLIQEKTCP